MGRDITWPAGDWDRVDFSTKVRLTHECCESYRGYDSVEKQLGKRFVIDADGKIKKGFDKWTMTEQETYAPTDYAILKTVILEPEDYIIASLRSENEKGAWAELRIFKVTGRNPSLSVVRPGLKIEIDGFWSNVPDSEWVHQVPKKLRKAVKKALKIPKRVLRDKT